MNKCGFCSCVIIADRHRVVCYTCEELSLNVLPGVDDQDHRRWFLDGL